MTVRWFLVAATVGAFAAGCGAPGQPAETTSDNPVVHAHGGGFHSDDCNGIRDVDIEKAAGSRRYTKAVVSDAGCFWQENTMIGKVGAGMGISTWWYRGSNMDTERDLEQRAGRTLSELSIDGNKGFKAYDDSACSIYVAKGGDVITWSIQTMNSATMPDLCSVVGQLAQLSQKRVN